MRKPMPGEFDSGDGNGVDWDEYDDIMGDYEDSQYDDMRDREMFKDDNDD